MEKININNVIDFETPQAIRRDFESDWQKQNFQLPFPFKEVIANNMEYKEALYFEFARLEIKPKEDLYIADLMDLSLLKDELEHNIFNETKSALYEGQWHDLHASFYELVSKNLLPVKYYGRFLSETNIVKVLKKIDTHLNNFRDYVFRNSNILQDEFYAKVVGEAIVEETKKFRQNNLSVDIIQFIIAEEDDNLISILFRAKELEENQQKELHKRYADLKKYFVYALKNQIKYIEKLELSAIDNSNDSQKYEITICDRILRELAIIKKNFVAQYCKYDREEMFPYLLDRDGRSGIDGKYIASFDIFSNVELFNLQLYKKHFTERFEGSTNHSLLSNQLTEIKEKAQEVRDYYNTNLTNKSTIVKEFVEAMQTLPTEKVIMLSEEHCAVATIFNYKPMELYLGRDKMNVPLKTENSKYPFRYHSTNYDFAFISQILIDFIEDIGILKVKESLSEVKQSVLAPLMSLVNNFDLVQMQDVYNHFKAGLVDKGYLSDENLISFLDCAFCKKIVPQKKFNLTDVQSKQKIYKVFGTYYRNTAGKPYGKQNKYAALLGEYFEGYTTTNVSNNFS